MDRAEHIVIDVSVTTSDQYTTLDFFLVFLALLLLILSLGVAINIRNLFIVDNVWVVLVAFFVLVFGLGFFVDVHFFLLFFFIDLDCEVFQDDTFEVAVRVPLWQLLFIA